MISANTTNEYGVRFTGDCSSALMTFWLVVNRSFGSEAANASFSVRRRMLATKVDCTPFLSTDLRVARTSLALLKYKFRLAKELGFGQRGFAFAGRLGPEKLLILLSCFETRLVGFSPPLRACTWFTAGRHCSVAKFWDLTCERLWS